MHRVSVAYVKLLKLQHQRHSLTAVYPSTQNEGMQHLAALLTYTWVLDYLKNIVEVWQIVEASVHCHWNTRTY